MFKSNHAASAPSLAPREWCVTIVGSLTLVYTAWSFGGVIASSLWNILFGSVATLMLALIPVPKIGKKGRSFNGSDGEHGNLKSFIRLLRAPFFWFSALFLLYMLIQASNPAAEMIGDKRGWWVQMKTPPLGTFLPSSVRSEFEPMNIWRMFVAFSAAFALAWAFKAGLRRRLSVLIVLWSFVLSGTVMAGVAMYQHFTGAEEVLWTLKSSNRYPWGSFFYRNQAVAYLNTTLAASCFLYFYHARKARRIGQSGGPHFLLFCANAVIAASIGLALSRGGILFGAIILSGFLTLALLQYLRSAFSLGRSLSISLILLALLTSGGYLTYATVDWEAMDERFGDVGATITEAEKDGRVLASRATWDMAQERLWLGWGGGSFRYIFPMFQRNYKEIYYARNHVHRGWEGRRFFRYAHNDILQFIAEYGVIGSSFLLLALLTLLAPLLWNSGDGLAYGAIILCLAVAVLLIHAFLDFIFHSPAVLTAFFAVLALAGSLLNLETQRNRN